VPYAGPGRYDSPDCCLHGIRNAGPGDRYGPAIWLWPEAVEDGGLIGYGPRLSMVAARARAITGKVPGRPSLDLGQRQRSFGAHAMFSRT
jgi:hypothetical protein